MNPASLARVVALLLPLALLGGALGSQYLGGLHPCEMCYWQRWPHGVAILLAALAFTAPAQSQRARTMTLLAALAIAISGAIGVYHAGVDRLGGSRQEVALGSRPWRQSPARANGRASPARPSAG